MAVLVAEAAGLQAQNGRVIQDCSHDALRARLRASAQLVSIAVSLKNPSDGELFVVQGGLAVFLYNLGSPITDLQVMNAWHVRSLYCI